MENAPPYDEEESRVSLAWPVLIYSAQLPVANEYENIFDTLILSLANIHVTDTRDAASKTHLPEEFVRVVQSSLCGRGLLDRHNVLTTDGRKEAERNRKIEMKDVCVLQDRISGELLPFISFEKLHKLVSNKSNSKKLLTFNKGTTGDSRKITAAKIYYERREIAEPNAQEVRVAYKMFKRRTQDIARDFKIPELAAGEIIVSKGCEKAYLHCFASMSIKNTDVVTVSDGLTGDDYYPLTEELIESPNMEDVVKRLKQILQDRQEKQGRQAESKGKDEKDAKGAEDAEAYSSAKGEKKTMALADSEKVSWLLDDAARKIESGKNGANAAMGSAAQKQHEKDKKKAAEELYEAIERTLAIVAKEHREDTLYDTMMNSDAECNARMAKSFAQSAGFNVTAQNERLFDAILPGKIRAALEESAEDDSDIQMQSLLALCLAGASQDSWHPMNTLAAGFADCLTFLCGIKRVRDSAMHGDRIDADEKLMDSILRRTRKMIRILMPQSSNEAERPESDASAQGGDHTRGNTEVEKAQRERLDASIALDEMFGVQQMRRTPPEQRSIMLCVQMSAKAGDYETLVQDSASLLQKMFIAIYKDYKEADECTDGGSIGGGGDSSLASRIKEKAESRARQAELLGIDERLPRSLANVNDNRVQMAAEGRDVSLGSSFIVFLAMTDIKRLVRMGKECPTLVQLVEELLDLRGHGNNIRGMNADEINRCKSRVLECVKKLEMVYYGGKR